MNIYFHLGLSKTGSSAIQRFCDVHQEDFIKAGYFHPNESQISTINGIGSGNGFELYQEVVANYNEPDALSVLITSWLGDKISKSKQLGCNNLIVSSEAFCTLSENQLSAFLGCLPKENFTYKFIVYSRDPYTWFFSSWLQSIKREGNRYWIDHALKKDPYKCLYPLLTPSVIKNAGYADQLTVIDYDLHKAQLLESFIKALDIPTDSKISTHLPNNPKINRSLTKQEFVIFYYANKYSQGNVSLSEKLASTIKDNQHSPPFFFINQVAVDIIDTFCENNGIPLTPFKSKDTIEMIDSEDELYKSLSKAEHTHLMTINTVTEFYKELFHTSRSLAIHKAHYYRESPFKNKVPAGFNIFIYLLLNDDVLFAAGDPYQHYVEFGQKDNRSFLID